MLFKIGLTRHLPITVEIKARQRHLATIPKYDGMYHRPRFHPKSVKKSISIKQLPDTNKVGENKKKQLI